MGRPYAKEVDALDDTYAYALDTDVGRVADILASHGHLPLLCVGSGGSVAAANFVARTYEHCFGHLAKSATPLQAIEVVESSRTVAAWLLTAGGSNEDARGSFERLAQLEPAQLAVVCCQQHSPIARLANRYRYATVHEFVPPCGRDGFLATNSLLTFIVVMSRAIALASGRTLKLPLTLAELVHPTCTRETFLADLTLKLAAVADRRMLSLIFDPALESAAIDFESRGTEAALKGIQLADIRNFAHGRHHWLAKHADETGVLALTTSALRPLVEATLKELPRTVPTIEIVIPGSGIRAELAGVTTSVFVAGLLGKVLGIDPGRPGVPPFGRRIYHLPARNWYLAAAKGSISPSTQIAIERKARTSVAVLTDRAMLQAWENAHGAFIRRLCNAKIRGLAIDYDGTLCDVHSRKLGIAPVTASELTRLLRQGLTIAVVTGRGKSVRQDLQEKLPKTVWPRVIVGYYNGGEIAALADDSHPAVGQTHPAIDNIANTLAACPTLCGQYQYERRANQIMVTPQNAPAAEIIWERLHGACLASADLPRVVKSGHSMDILTAQVTKRSVLSMLEMPLQQIACIGDCGRWPGNDYELLRHPLSLSAHHVSADPASCWNLAPPGIRGVDATLYYLNALRNTKTRRIFAFRFPKHRVERS